MLNECLEVNRKHTVALTKLFRSVCESIQVLNNLYNLPSFALAKECKSSAAFWASENEARVEIQHLRHRRMLRIANLTSVG